MAFVKYLLLIIGFWVAGLSFARAQGCSDAGFCTMNSFKPEAADSTAELLNQWKLGAFVGSADYAIVLYGNYLEYNRQLNEKFGLDVKLTTLAQQGNDIAVFGLSDVFLNTHYSANDKLRFTLGAKIPLSSASRMRDNLPLPLDYQASLGTFDFIFGVGYIIKNWQLVAAIQQPLTQNNNQFLATDYPLTSPLAAFQSTNGFKRSGDVLLRLSYPVEVTHKLRLTPSLLPIYHLANDKYTDVLNVEREIIGSKGLTLNGNIYFDYALNTKSSLQLNLAMPFIVRDARPDGLTRSFIANLEYRVRF
jgi:hypothetical protein